MVFKPRPAPPISATYNLRHNGVLDKLSEELAETPGVKPWRRNVVEVPYNAGWIVRDLLKRRCVPKRSYQWSKPELLKAPSDVAGLIGRLDRLGEVDPEVYRGFACDFQLADAGRCVGIGGGHIWASPGAGKTLIAILWFLAVCSGAVLVVTVAVARLQFAQAITQFTRAEKLRPLALRPAALHRAALVRCDGLAAGWTPCNVRVPWSEGFCAAHAGQRPPDWEPRLEQPISPDALAAYLKREKLAGRRPIVVVGWEQMRDNVDLLLKLLRPSAVVFDESHIGKAPKRAKYEADDRGKPTIELPLHNISAHAYKLACGVRFRMGMTATPGDNRLIDLWGQLSLIEVNGWGKTVRRFAFAYCDAQNTEHGWSVRDQDGSDGVSNSDELDGRIAFTAPIYETEDGQIVHRVPYEISHAGLPPMRRTVMHIDVGAQDPVLPGLARELRALTRRVEKGDRSAAGLLVELQLVVAAERKRAAVVRTVLDYLSVGKGKILVYTGRKRLVEWLIEKLTKPVEAAGGQILVITGDTPDDEVYARRDAYWESEGPCVLLGTYQKIGTAMDRLQDSDLILWQMLPNKVGLYDQGEGRGDRKGRVRPLEVIYLLAEGSIDQRMLDVSVGNLKSTGAVHAGSRMDTLGVDLKGLDDPDILSDFVAQLAREQEYA